MDYFDTICAPATIPGTGAITLIRLSGPDALAIADKTVSCKNGSIAASKGYSLKFGKISAEDGSTVDEVLCSVFKAPASYTGEDSVEINCHASSFIARTVLELLCANGARIAEPGEFTRRAFLNGKMDLAQAEAVADVISSDSAISHKVAMNQLKGGYSQELAALRGSLLEITSLMELELDFSEEDVEFADRSKVRELVSKTLEKVSSLAESFHLGNAIKNGVPVVIIGEPNAGKSTLLNSLLGEDRAIVSDIEGTTRDSIEETFTLDGVLFRLIDTAGLRETDETVEKMGIERTRKMVSAADVIIALVDISKSEEQISSTLATLEATLQLQPAAKVIMVANKVDLLSDSGIEGSPAGVNKNVLMVNDFVSHVENKAIALNLSAKSGYGMDELKKALVTDVKERINAGENGSTLVTNARHYEALRHSADSLSAVITGLDSGLPTDLVSQDLREALYHLGTITGSISTDEVLGQIFSKFCIGK